MLTTTINFGTKLAYLFALFISQTRGIISVVESVESERNEVNTTTKAFEMLVGEAFYLLNDVSRQNCHSVESTLSTAHNLPFFVSDKMNDESELICEFIDGKGTFNEKFGKHFIVDERINKLAKAISPIAIERQFLALKTSIITILSNKTINTVLLGNFSTQLTDIFALFEQDLFKNGLQSLYNAAVINAEENANIRQTGHKIKITNEKEKEEKFEFWREQKRSKRRAPRNNGGSPFNALTILLLIVSGLRLARSAADNLAGAAPPPTPMWKMDPTQAKFFAVIIFLPVIAFVAALVFLCCKHYCYQPCYDSYRTRVVTRQREREWQRERQQLQRQIQLQRQPTFRTAPSASNNASSHPNRARLLPSNIALSDALANLAEQTKTDRSVQRQIRTQPSENVPNDCSICLAALEPSASASYREQQRGGSHEGALPGLRMIAGLPQCKHFFHYECLKQWLRNHHSCPMCRANAQMGQFDEAEFASAFRPLQLPFRRTISASNSLGPVDEIALLEANVFTPEQREAPIRPFNGNDFGSIGRQHNAHGDELV